MPPHKAHVLARVDGDQGAWHDTALKNNFGRVGWIHAAIKLGEVNISLCGNLSIREIPNGAFDQLIRDLPGRDIPANSGSICYGARLADGYDNALSVDHLSPVRHDPVIRVHPRAQVAVKQFTINPRFRLGAMQPFFIVDLVPFWPGLIDLVRHRKVDTVFQQTRDLIRTHPLRLRAKGSAHHKGDNARQPNAFHNNRPFSVSPARQFQLSRYLYVTTAVHCGAKRISNENPSDSKAAT